MAGDHFEFDESGDTFFCFFVAFYTLILIPVTYFCWPSTDYKDNYEPGKRKCMCQPCQVKRHHLKTSSPWRRLRKLVVKGAFFMAWIIFSVMIYKLALMEKAEVGFDPFLQLEIDRDASASDIRRAYKRLSVKYHPDKGGDPKRFILISKAYAALTNEESRKNWEQYGNPDGPEAAHFGIALPKWMIEKENFYLVIGAYVLLFMLLLPIVVGMWWYNTMRFSSSKVLLDTIRYFCGAFMRSPYMAMPRVIKVLSNAYEFNPNFNKEVACRPSDNVELPPLIMQIPIFTIFKKAIVGSPSSVKARALIYAHLERIDLPANTLHLDRQYIVKNCPRLLDEMINSLLYVLAVAVDEAGSRQKTPQHLATIENCIHLIPMLVQALSESASPLLQLPHIGPTQLRYMMSKQRNIKSIRQLVQLPDDRRRGLLRSLSDEQYRDVLNVCASMPHLRISYRCEVLDDDDPSIWPLSMVTATITLERHPLLEPGMLTSPSTTFSELPSYTTGNGGTSVRSSDLATYDHHNPESQLYAAADISVDPSVVVGYGEFADEDVDPYNSGNNKGKKVSSVPIWDKNKRKKQPRKGKHKKADWKQQQQNRVAQSSTGNQANHVQDGSFKEIPESGAGDGEDDNVKSFHSDDIDELKMDKPGHDGGCSEDEEPKSSVAELSSNKASQSSADRVKSSERRPHCTHLVHCPYFPVEKFEGWWIYLVDRKTRQLVTKPLYISTLQSEEEIPLRFVAPSIPGSYFYTLCVRSDSYVDFDFFETIRFTVCPLPEKIAQYLKEQEAHMDSSSSSEADSSEDEEDDSEVEDLSEPEELPVSAANVAEDNDTSNEEEDSIPAWRKHEDSAE